MATGQEWSYHLRMKLPQTTTPLLAAVLLGAMGLAFAYQGLSFPPSFLGAAIFFGGAVFALRMAMRKPNA
jgi:hypothetical protein